MSWKPEAPIKFHVSGLDFYGYYQHNPRRECTEVTLFSHDPVSKLVRHRLDMDITDEDIQNAGKSVEEMFHTDQRLQEYVFCWAASEIVFPIRHQRDDGFQNLFMEKAAKKILIDWIESLP